MGLSASDNVWVTPRAIKKEFETVARGDGAFILNIQGQSSAADMAGLSTDQKESGECFVAEASLVVKEEPDAAEVGQVFASPAVVLGDASMVDGVVISSAATMMGSVTKADDVLVTEADNVGVVTEDSAAAEAVVMLPRLADSVANRGADVVNSVIAKTATANIKVDIRSSRPAGVFRPVLAPVDDPVEPRQSECIKMQQSGDEDLVQKATQRAKVRNLELDPSKSGNKFLFLSFSDEQVIEKVASIGISLGNDSAEIVSTLKSIKNL